MRGIIWSKRYKKDLKRMIRQHANLDLHDEVVNLLCEDKPLPEKYRDHALSGELRNYRELHIAPDWLLVYEKKQDTILLLAATGSHTELFD